MNRVSNNWISWRIDYRYSSCLPAGDASGDSGVNGSQMCDVHDKSPSNTVLAAGV